MSTAEQVPARPLRVGIIGCGAVTQAIHLPTLERLGELWTISHVFDVDAVVCAEVARRVGATAVSDADALIADPSVDVVAICSPHPFHAAQVIAACEAGKRAVLCEKPLCGTVEEARAIAEASRRTGVPVLTATMHLFDPAFAAASDAWDVADDVLFVESVCFLPPNEVFVDQSTQLFVNPDVPPRAPAPMPRPALMDIAILGLASHHIPLVRRFVPVVDSITVAEPLLPFGYDITMTGGGAVARLVGLMTDAPRANWNLQVVAARSELSVEFPPSYVQAGSATASLTTADREFGWSFAESGYVAEWRLLHGMATGAVDGMPYLDDAVADFELASRVIERFVALEGQPA